MRTFFLQEDPTFCHHDRDVSVDETLSVIVRQGNGDVGVFDAHVERDAEDALRFCPG